MLNRVWQWMGNMFYRHQPINVIYGMRYHELKMWNEWHEIMCKEDTKRISAMGGL